MKCRKFTRSSSLCSSSLLTRFVGRGDARTVAVAAGDAATAIVLIVAEGVVGKSAALAFGSGFGLADCSLSGGQGLLRAFKHTGQSQSPMASASSSLTPTQSPWYLGIQEVHPMKDRAGASINVCSRMTVHDKG